MKKHFEAYLTFIENELGVKLLDWQKIVLRAVYDGEYPVVQGRLGGKLIAERATEMLKEEINRDTGVLPHRMYDLDGYSADTAMCDESWNENIEWEKEK